MYKCLNFFLMLGVALLISVSKIYGTEPVNVDNIKIFLELDQAWKEENYDYITDLFFAISATYRERLFKNWLDQLFLTREQALHFINAMWEKQSYKIVLEIFNHENDKLLLQDLIFYLNKVKDQQELLPPIGEFTTSLRNNTTNAAISFWTGVAGFIGSWIYTCYRNRIPKTVERALSKARHEWVNNPSGNGEFIEAVRRASSNCPKRTSWIAIGVLWFALADIIFLYFINKVIHLNQGLGMSQFLASIEVLLKNSIKKFEQEEG
ncbi:MAG TPA: hypothetical protein VHA52_09450 [Candidatus Babeliaceae bacterium]|nr:hypothetical protein [Candidatus Babeliaceae bacterium]